MTGIAARHVVIWIDNHEAVLLAFEVGRFDSSVGRNPGDGWFLHRVDAQRHSLTQRYYGAVLNYLEPEDQILILGPGQAKRELRQQIEQPGILKGKVIGLQYASKLTDVELVSPMSREWLLEDASLARNASRLDKDRGSLKGKLKSSFRSR